MDDYERLDAVEAAISSIEHAISEVEECHSDDVEDAKVFLNCALGALKTVSIGLSQKVEELQMRERSLEAAEFARTR